MQILFLLVVLLKYTEATLTANTTSLCDASVEGLIAAGAGAAQTTTSPYYINATYFSNSTALVIESSDSTITSFTNIILYTIDPQGKRVGKFGIRADTRAALLYRNPACSSETINACDMTATKTIGTGSNIIALGWVGAMVGNYTLMAAVWKDQSTYWTFTLTMPITLTSGGANPPKVSSKTINIIIGSVVGGACLMGIVICWIVYRRKRENKLTKTREQQSQFGGYSQYQDNQTNYSQSQYGAPEGVTETYYQRNSATTAWTGADEERRNYV